MLDLGVELDVVREILGHTSIKTTERYAHVMVKPQRAALEKLGRCISCYTSSSVGAISTGPMTFDCSLCGKRIASNRRMIQSPVERRKA